MSIPATPLVESIAKQIDREIQAYADEVQLRYQPATPENLKELEMRFREHFQSDDIYMKYSKPDWNGRVRVNVSIGDKFLLRRLKEINSTEYNKITQWMAFHGMEIPVLDDGPLPYAGQSQNTGIQVFDATTDEKHLMAQKIIQSEVDRRQFIQDNLSLGDSLRERPESSQSAEQSGIRVFDAKASSLAYTTASMLNQSAALPKEKVDKEILKVFDGRSPSVPPEGSQNTNGITIF